MRRICCFILIVLGACSFSVRADDECVRVERVVLGCGLEVVVYSDPGLSDQGTQVWTRIGRGSMSERDGERGASLVAARAAMHGVGEFSRGAMLAMIGVDPDSEGYIGVEDRGGVMVLNGHVVFMLEVQGRGVSDGIRVARGLLDGYAPGDEAIGVVRDGVLEELREIEEERGERWAYMQWLPELLDGSGYSRMAMPSVEECEALEAGVVRSFVNREWNAGQSTVLIVGDVDPDRAIAEAREIFEGCGSGEETASSAVEIIKPSVAGRVATIGVEGLGGSRIGMVWFGDGRDVDWDGDGHGLALSMTLSGEAMRYRVNRMLRAEFSYVVDARVEVGMLMGRIPFGQIVVEMREGSADQWDEVLGSMVREWERVIQYGISGEEFLRARGWVDQQWGYEIDQWAGSTSRERARSLNWMMSAGRPVVALDEWAYEGRELLGGFGVEQVNSVVDEVFGTVEPAVVVVLDQEQAPSVADVREVLRRVDDDEVFPLDGWIAELGGPILDRSFVGGEVEEINVHRDSGVISAVLSNGVVVRHREMNSEQGGDRSVRLVVRLGFDSLEESEMHGVGEVFVAAIEQGAIRSRTDEEIRAVMIEHGISLSVERRSWRIEFHVKIDVLDSDEGTESFERAVELVFAYLTDLRIEQELVEQVAQEGAEGSRPIGIPIDAMEAGIARALGVKYTLRDMARLGEGVEARSVREWIERRVRGGQIEIGIAGPIGAQRAIEICASYLGEIDGGPTLRGDLTDAIEVAEIGGQETVRMVDPRGREGVIVGFGACELGELDDLRALTVAGLVLDDRLEAAAAVMGGGVYTASGAFLPDLVPGRVVMFGRAECESESIDDWAAVIGGEIGRVAEEGISAQELRDAKERIGELIDEGFIEAEFWASRLAMVSERGGGVESIWGMPDAYRELDVSRVNRVFRRWHQEGEYIRVELVGEAR